MESILLVEGVGGFSSFEEIENALSIEELVLLHEQLMKSKQNHYRMLASFQGIDLSDGGVASEGADDLPEEVIEAERAWQEKKKKALEENPANGLESFGIGYKKV